MSEGALPTGGAAAGGSSAALVTVPVIFDPENLSLTVSPEAPATLAGGSSLIWAFQTREGGGTRDGLPSGWAPGIVFVDGPPQASRPGAPPLYCGPFAHLRRSARSVWGKGNNGLAGTYSYRAVVVELREGQPGTLMSDLATVTNAAAEPDSTPEAMVSVRFVDRQFEVDPEPLVIHPGDAVRWRFVDLPTGYVPSLVFGAFTPRDGGGPLDPHLLFGPFERMDLAAGTIAATGHCGRFGSFDYRILLLAVDASGDAIELYRSPDPHVDVEPDPIGG